MMLMRTQRSPEFDRDVIACVPRLRSVAIRLARNSVDADDLVQWTVVAALSHHTMFQSGTSMIAWLTVILRNAFLSRLRKDKRLVADGGDAAMGLTCAAEQEYGLIFDELMERVAQLPLGHRTVLNLVAQHGLPYDEIAERLGICVGTVKSRVSRSRAYLREEQSELTERRPSGKSRDGLIQELWLSGMRAGEIADEVGGTRGEIMETLAALRRRRAA